MVLTRRAVEAENAVVGKAEFKQGAKRRALGNIANQQPTKHGAQVQAKAGDVTRRTAAAPAPAPAPSPALAAAPKPATNPAAVDARPARHMPAAARRSKQRAAGQVPAEEAVARRTRARRAAAAARPPTPLPDIDSCDAADPLAAADYVAEIYSYYKRVEPAFLVNPEYLTRQSHINGKMRTILIDWLVDVHLKFKLVPETLYLTTSVIDRFLEKMTVQRSNLQLVGITAMLIAAKIEEVWPPQVTDFVYICDRIYNKEQILSMEKIMLSTLRFNLTVPTPYHFLSRFLKAAGATQDKVASNYATYLVELTLADCAMLKYKPSMLSASAIYAANVALGRCPFFPEALQRHSGYSVEGLTECATALAQLHRQAHSAMYNATFKKFGSPALLGVAAMEPPLALFGLQAPLEYRETLGLG